MQVMSSGIAVGVVPGVVSNPRIFAIAVRAAFTRAAKKEDDGPFLLGGPTLREEHRVSVGGLWSVTVPSREPVADFLATAGEVKRTATTSRDNKMRNWRKAAGTSRAENVTGAGRERTVGCCVIG
jgi:hypothetical protein